MRARDPDPDRVRGGERHRCRGRAARSPGWSLNDDYLRFGALTHRRGDERIEVASREGETGTAAEQLRRMLDGEGKDARSVTAIDAPYAPAVTDAIADRRPGADAAHARVERVRA